MFYHRVVVVENDQDHGAEIVQVPIEILPKAAVFFRGGVFTLVNRLEGGAIADPEVEEGQQERLVAEVLRLRKLHQVAPALVRLVNLHLVGEVCQLCDQSLEQLSTLVVDHCGQVRPKRHLHLWFVEVQTRGHPLVTIEHQDKVGDIKLCYGVVGRPLQSRESLLDERVRFIFETPEHLVDLIDTLGGLARVRGQHRLHLPHRVLLVDCVLREPVAHQTDDELVEGQQPLLEKHSVRSAQKQKVECVLDD